MSSEEMGDEAKMIRKILFPVDFSDSSVGMAAYVKRAAAYEGMRIRASLRR